MAVVHQVMRQRKAGRPHAGDQHPLAGGGERHWPGQVQRIPPCQQAVDLEAPGQVQHIFQRPRLGLRNIDRVLLLIDAGLHAIVADAMAGGRAHGIVDDDDGECRQRLSPRLGLVHLGNLFFQRAARQGHAEGAFLECTLARFSLGRLVAQAARAAVLALVMAPDAIVRLVERACQVGARIGERKTLPPPQMVRVQPVAREARAGVGHLVMHQMRIVELFRYPEQDASAVPGNTRRAEHRPGGITLREVEFGRLAGCILLPAQHMIGKGKFGQRLTESRCQFRRERRAVERRRLVRLQPLDCAPLHEVALHLIEGRQLRMFT